MAALSLRNNEYASDLEVRRTKRSFTPQSRAVGIPYSRGASSRSVSEYIHRSSFWPVTEAIDSLFSVRAVDVYLYLQRHVELYSILLRSRAEIYWLFGSRTEVLLRMEHDPEEECGPRLLVAIQTGLTAASAIALIDAFDHRWWVSVSPETRTLVKIDVEYI